LSTNLNPLVSIITPVYNGANFLDDLIQSVQHQDYSNTEHIVIDDGSSDDGATISVLSRYPHLRWWTRPNRGQYATMNEGLLAADGDIVCFISSDDMLLPGAVKKAICFLSKNPNANGVYGSHIYMNVDGHVMRFLQPFKYAPSKCYPYSHHISHSSLFIEKDSLLVNNLLFDEKLRYVGDYDWIIRIFQSSINIERISENLSILRIHDEQTSNECFYPMRVERFSVQIQRNVSFLTASIFRKIMFVSRVINIAINFGINEAVLVMKERLLNNSTDYL